MEDRFAGLEKRLAQKSMSVPSESKIAVVKVKN